MLPIPGTEFRDGAGSKAERCDDRHLASILGSTLETLKALVSGHPGFVQKLILCATTTAAHFHAIPMTENGS